MVGKKQGVGPKALREEGLVRTDNDLELTSWPVISMINQKNYYTEYLKRDEQILPLRVLQEQKRERLETKLKGRNDDADMDVDDDANIDEGGETLEEQAAAGSKVIVIHPGSENLRIGLGSDALPKAVPMVIARRWTQSEAEEGNGEPLPKRIKLEDGTTPTAPEKMFGQEWGKQYGQMCQDLKVHMRANKRRVLPNSKELVVNFNSRSPPETISQHNDPMQIEYTQLPADPAEAPEYICGRDALRIPDDSNPRYRLFWPLRRGWWNEDEYETKSSLFIDLAIIVTEAIKTQCGLTNKKEWSQYGVVVVIPDLYERNYVFQFMDLIMRDMGFNKISFIQESLAATFGAGTTISCVVDIGAQKTSISCVEEGMVIENSRVNVKIGGYDVTDTFIKMMLFDHFPYEDINLKRRYDAILADELKTKYCTMNEDNITVQLFDFYLRAPNQDTRKYNFKAYDEVLLAPQGLFQPLIFDNSDKLRGRRKLLSAAEDIYDGSLNDPASTAQTEIISRIAPSAPSATYTNGTDRQAASSSSAKATPQPASTPARQQPNPFARLQDGDRATSELGSPAPEGAAGDGGTPAPGAAAADAEAAAAAAAAAEREDRMRDDVLPVIGLDTAVVSAIEHGARGDEKKFRDFAGGIMVIGGGSLTPGIHAYLEERLKIIRPGWAKEFLVGSPPRELDPQSVVWKGASVFGKLGSTREVWVGREEYDFLGTRALAYKCLWQF